LNAASGESRRAGFTQEGEIPMDCKSESASHYAGCPCHEERWRERLAAAESRAEKAEAAHAGCDAQVRELVSKALRAVRGQEAAESRAASLSRELLDAMQARDSYRASAELRVGMRREFEALLGIGDTMAPGAFEAGLVRLRALAAAESRAERLLTVMQHLLKAFLTLHRACGTGSAEQWPEVEDARAALAELSDAKGKEAGR